MVKATILRTHDPLLNPGLLVVLISPVFLRDYKLKEEGLHCFFTQSIFDYWVMIKTFLSALSDITNTFFYFEVINDYEAILKAYGSKLLHFSQEILFKSLVSSLESDS
ncbi:MAG: hypothetical protein JSV04_15135 [Candidatus Heimdallarchaeota archaeon]|nr:MAG: hypothetical protein JSV04_15135 [Candidatus Heimdallarchaeota archaeon]